MSVFLFLFVSLVFFISSFKRPVKDVTISISVKEKNQTSKDCPCTHILPTGSTYLSTHTLYQCKKQFFRLFIFFFFGGGGVIVQELCES